jgi:HlyD family secretion protein
MKKKTVLYTLVGTAGAAAVLVWAFAPRPVMVELALVTQGRYLQTIDEDAKTRLTDRYVVSAPLAGRLARISLREGDAVAADAVVATLHPVLPAMLDERARRELRARKEAAEAAVERAAARIERATVMLDQARAELARSEELAAGGFLAAAKLDTDRHQALAAQKEVDAALAEQHVAGHDLDQARAALGTANGPADGATEPPATGFPLRSPIAGQVMRILLTSETPIALGTPLLEIGDTSRLEVTAELLTTDALSARSGTAVLIERWGGEGTLDGRVSRVEPAGFTKVSALGVEEQRVRVIIAIESPFERWRQLGDGYRVSVRIVTTDEPRALLVPVGAVFPLPAPSEVDQAAGRRHAVFVLEANRVRQVPIRIAGRNGVHARVVDGLSAGRSVVVYPPNQLRDGARVEVTDD